MCVALKKLSFKFLMHIYRLCFKTYIPNLYYCKLIIKQPAPSIPCIDNACNMQDTAPFVPCIDDAYNMQDTAAHLYKKYVSTYKNYHTNSL